MNKDHKPTTDKFGLPACTCGRVTVTKITGLYCRSGVVIKYAQTPGYCRVCRGKLSGRKISCSSACGRVWNRWKIQDRGMVQYEGRSL